uniref:C2H2-type domain-containing protein n=1 Tax=Panagrolaimus sp. JU765 TaxID=591449 RepID=A0AC34RI88_9BILA
MEKQNIIFLLLLNHFDELYENWENVHVKKGAKGQNPKSLCTVPPRFGIHSTQTLATHRVVDKQKSRALMIANQTLLHPGLPLCARHFSTILSWTATEFPVEATTQTTPVINNENTPRRRQSNMLSPECQVLMDQLDLSDNEGSPCVKKCKLDENCKKNEFTPHRPKPKTCSLPANVRDSFFHIVGLLEINPAIATSNWDTMVKRQQNKHLRGMRKLLKAFAIYKVGDQDAAKLLNAYHQSNANDEWKHEPLDDFMVEARRQYYAASSNRAKIAILSVIVETKSKVEVAKFIPSLTSHLYKKAKEFAKRLKAGWKFDDTKIERRRARGDLEQFVHFVADPSITKSLPMGKAVTKINGKPFDVPSTVRSLQTTDIITKFLIHFREEIGRDPELSNATMAKILNVFGSRQRRARDIVDSFEVAGSEGLEKLRDIICNLASKNAISREEKHFRLNVIDEIEQFMKHDMYGLLQLNHLSGNLSVSWALSDAESLISAVKGSRTKSALFQHVPQQLKSSLTQACSKCNLFPDLIAFIRDKINAEENDEENDLFKIDVEDIETAVTVWRNHIIRSWHSDFTRRDLITSLKPRQAFLTLDFSQKLLPRNSDETQADYYGKAGISWHISHVLIRQENNNLATHSFIHVSGYCDQTSALVSGILNNLLPILKRNGVDSVIIRSDGAGYYHSAALMFSMASISKSAGVKIERYRVSEAQNGKSTADAETSRFKRGINYWLNKGNDVNGPDQMIDALKDCGERMKGFSVYHIRCPDRLKTSPNLISGISNLTDFEFFENKLIARKHYKIGKGLEILYDKSNSFEAVDLGMPIRSHVFNGDGSSIWRIPKLQKLANTNPKTKNQPTEAQDDEDPEGLYSCDFNGCEFVAISQQGLDLHKLRGSHKFSRAALPLAEEALQLFVQELSGIRETHNNALAPVTQNVQMQVLQIFVPKEGFALRPQQQSIDKTAEMKQFLDDQLEKAFDLGNKRVDPFAVSRLMKKYKTGGNIYFTAKQRLSPAQISAYYGQKIRQTRPKNNQKRTNMRESMMAAKNADIQIGQEEDVDDDPIFADEATDILETVREKLPELNFN